MTLRAEAPAPAPVARAPAELPASSSSSPPTSAPASTPVLTPASRCRPPSSPPSVPRWPGASGTDDMDRTAPIHAADCRTRADRLDAVGEVWGTGEPADVATTA